MQKVLRTMLAWLVLPGAIAMLPFFQAISFAAPAATMTMIPSPQSVAQQGTVTVSVYENSGTEPINAAQVNFSYPTNLLQFVGVTNSSAFGIVAQNNTNNGSIQLARGALPSVTGNQLIASVTFNALTTAATANLTFTSGTSVVSANSNTNILSGSTGTTVIITAPVSTSGGGGGASAGGGNGGSNSGGNTTTHVAPPVVRDTTPPAISAIAVSNITTKSANVGWTTSKPATSEVDYSVSGVNLSVTDSSYVLSHSLVLSSPLITPGTTYTYKVVSVDQAGNRATSANGTFTTKGLSLIINVQDSNGNVIPGAIISYNNQTYTANDQGRVTLIDLPTGKLTILITYQGQRFNEIIQVAQQTPDGNAQTVTFKIAANVQDTKRIIAIIIIALLCLIAVFLAIFSIWRKHHNPWNGYSGSGASANQRQAVVMQGLGVQPGPEQTVYAPQQQPLPPQQYPNNPNQNNDQSGRPPSFV